MLGAKQTKMVSYEKRWNQKGLNFLSIDANLKKLMSESVESLHWN